MELLCIISPNIDHTSHSGRNITNHYTSTSSTEHHGIFANRLDDVIPRKQPRMEGVDNYRCGRLCAPLYEVPP